jgi:hypothetical protein
VVARVLGHERQPWTQAVAASSPRDPGPTPHSETPEARAAMPPLTLRTPAQTRANITARCAELVSQRDDLDPTGPIYEAKTLQIDAALSALWALGPADV